MRISDWSSDVCSSDLGIPADETSLHSRKCSRVDRRQAPFSGQQRRKPIIDLRHQRLVAQFFAPGKHCANTERPGTFGPGKKVQPSCPHTLQQRSRNCFRVGAVVGSTGKTNGADSPFTQRSEERRVGKECVSTCRSRWSPYN